MKKTEKNIKVRIKRTSQGKKEQNLDANKGPIGRD